MSRTIRIIAINLVVLALLLSGFEILFRLIGEQTINQMERANKGWKLKYESVCQQMRCRQLEVRNLFYTDGDGIFRANPAYALQAGAGDAFGIDINSDGFRGNAFKLAETPRTKVLLIGDSFTWGAGANPITASFADCLQDAGYYIYNAGIPGTDPAQYARVARKYIPLLKPNVVVVCLYMGNDLRLYPHPVQPHRNLFYMTNFGMIRGYDDNGKYFENAQEAFEYLRKKKCGQCSGVWDYFLYKTVAGKAIYGVLNRKQYYEVDRKRLWVRRSLEEIQRASRTGGADFLVFLIPVKNRNEHQRNTIEKTSSAGSE